MQSCQAARLGELLERAWIGYDQADLETRPGPRGEISSLVALMDERIDALQTGISFVQASSPAGMLVQLAVGVDEVQLAETSYTDAVRSAVQEYAKRCLSSVADALSRMTGVECEPSCVARYLPARSDRSLCAADAVSASDVSSEVSPPSVADGSFRTTVEAELIALNEIGTRGWEVYYEAFEAQTEAEEHPEPPMPRRGSIWLTSPPSMPSGSAVGCF